MTSSTVSPNARTAVTHQELGQVSHNAWRKKSTAAVPSMYCGMAFPITVSNLSSLISNPRTDSHQS